MRPIVLILVAVALGIAGLTAVLMNRLLSVQPAPSQISQSIAAPSTEDILVVAGAIRPGTPVAAADLHYEAWPSAALESRFIRRGSGDDPKTGFIGTVARRPLAAGEPMTADAVFRQDEAGLLAGMLSPGMRAVAIPVTATSGVAGFVLPHDHVDVLLNQDVNAAVAQGGSHALAGGVARFSSEAVLTDLRVLAVDDKLTKQDGAPNMTGRTVTLEVTPKDAEVLLLAGKMGELTLALRSVAAGEYAAPSGSYTSDVEVSRALQAQFGGPATTPASMPSSARMVRVNRGGATSTQSFAN